MMPALMHIASPLPEAKRNARIYAGDVIVFRDYLRVAGFLDMLRARCRMYLGDDPEQVHTRKSAAALEKSFETLRADLQRDEDISQAWREVLAELGADLAVTYGDKAVIRGQPPHTNHDGSRLAPLTAHRDTWGTNIAAQTNWWAPLFDTPPERTLLLYPGYFARAVANDSTGWDFKAMLRAHQSGGTNHYPLLPTSQEALSPDEGLAVSLLPGDLLCFSGAHLHASVPNTTGATRLSFETRTVNRDDAMADYGAPNVDGGAVYTAYSLFRNVENGHKLGGLQPR